MVISSSVAPARGLLGKTSATLRYTGGNASEEYKAAVHEIGINHTRKREKSATRPSTKVFQSVAKAALAGTVLPVLPVCRAEKKLGDITASCRFMVAGLSVPLLPF